MALTFPATPNDSIIPLPRNLPPVIATVLALRVIKLKL